MTRKRILALAVALSGFMPLVLQGQSNSQVAAGDMFITLSDPGSVTCIRGLPTGSFPLCSPDTTQIVWRDFSAPLILVNVTGTAAAQVAGIIAAQGNCNLDESYAGPCWGTFELATPGGSWEGSWSGRLGIMAGAADLSFVGRGASGDLEGLHLRLEAFSAGGSPYDPVPFTARVYRVQH
jgi:hypothetical protein